MQQFCTSVSLSLPPLLMMMMMMMMVMIVVEFPAYTPAVKISYSINQYDIKEKSLGWVFQRIA